jgi:lysophospholipase L1-like esterase
MPLGDSITWDFYFGEDRTDAERSGYRNYLWYKLRDIGYDADFVGSRTTGGAIHPSFDGDNEGHTGWTSYEIAESVYHFLEMNPADVILLHIGTNDFDSSPSGVEQILDEIDRFENENNMQILVILARIITLPSEASLISEFNNNIEAMANARIKNGDDIQIVDMENGAGLNYQADLIDNVHPNDCGYEKMANVWYRALTQRVSPGITYADCGDTDSNEEVDEESGDEEESDESIDVLYAFPSTLVNPSYILSIDVDKETNMVVFTTGVPDNGIVF